MTQSQSGPQPFIGSGSPDIDAVRREIGDHPTTAENSQKRALLFYLWIGALQQQGADTRSFYETDTEFYRLQRKLVESGPAHEVAPVDDAETSDGTQLEERMNRLIDQAYSQVEEIQATLHEVGPIAMPHEGDPSEVPPRGRPPHDDMDADWPEFQANNRNTGFTTAPGPQYGRQVWKLPIGLGWYSRPVVQDDRVYIASPGMYTTSFCFDLQTGEELWKSTQDHPAFGIYKYPAIASTPVVLDDVVVLREINSHGGNYGQARHLVYVDKKGGRTLSRSYAGHIDYRTQYAPVAANEEYCVYPFGVHEIYGAPPKCQNLNRLICASVDNTARYWDFNIGDIDALAEPVLTSDTAYCGTMEGYLYALRLGETRAEGPVRWSFRADGALNTAVEVGDDRVYFGSNGGSVYCLGATSGELAWVTQAGEANPAARKHFSTPRIDRDRLYVGAADGHLYCLDAQTGRIHWHSDLGEWIRSRPVVTGNGIAVATLDGKLHLVDFNGRVSWSRDITTHPIYSDLAGGGAIAPSPPSTPPDADPQPTAGADRIVLTDSNLYAYCIDHNGEVVWKRSLLCSFQKDGMRIFTDQLSGGTYFQSKPTAYRGLLYYGTPSGFLFAVDADTGDERWRFEMGAAISVGPACANGKVYAGQQGGERFFYCLDATEGTLVWKQTLPGGWVWGSATVDEGRVYVPTVSGYAVCLDGANGHIIWMYPTAKSIPAEPAVKGDLVYFGSWSRSLYAFDKRTGEIAWKQNGVSLDSGTLVIHDDKIFVPHHSNVFSSFDAETGELITSGNHDEDAKGQYANFNASPAIHGDRGFFSARGGIGLSGVPLFSTLYCVDNKTADIRWTYPDGGGLSAPAIANGRVYIASGNTPFLYCLDEESGKLHWVYKLGHRTEESTLCIYRERLYVLAADGYLHSVE